MQKRLVALDVFRGATIAFMILVNNPGSWSAVYRPLLHAEWHGCTPTDWVFPFFLFIVGVAIPLALGKRVAQGDARGDIIGKILRRTATIFGLGLLLAAYPRLGMAPEHPLALLHYLLLGTFLLGIFLREAINQPQWTGERTARRRRILTYVSLAAALGMIITGVFAYDLSHLRIPGVLQRIALVYGVCSLLFLRMSPRGLVYTGIGILLAYWGLMTLVPVPVDAVLREALASGNLDALATGGAQEPLRQIADNWIAPNLGAGGNLGAWLDRTLLGGHLWSAAKYWDPEGLLSTLPAVVTGIIGMLTGMWLQTNRDDYRKLTGILAVGAILVGLGLTWDLAFPINKKIWTSSYVLYVGGVAMLCLGVIYWLIDVLGYRRGWTKPFVVYGTNPLFAYVLSGLLVKTAINIKWETPEGTVNLWSWIYQQGFERFLSPYNASLAFAIANVLVGLAAVWVLYRKRIFIKV